VEVADGVAHLAGTDTVAGSTATMDRLFRFAVTHGVDGRIGGSALHRDDALALAVHQSSVNPARALGLTSPVLQPGTRADLVALDTSLVVTAVMSRGAWMAETVSGA